MKTLFSLLLIFPFSILIKAQTPFVQDYGDSTVLERATGVETFKDGYLYLGGFTMVGQNSTAEFNLYKLDLSGNVIWYKEYGTSNNETLLSLSKTEDNSLLLAGSSKNKSSKALDWLVYKVSKSGNVIWSSQSTGRSKMLNHMEELPTGNIIGCGYSVDTANKHNDAYLVKLDKDGQVIWEKTYTDNLNNYAISLAQTSDNGFIVCGDTEKSDGEYDTRMMRVDKDGNIIWKKELGDHHGNGSKGMSIGWDGYYYIVGEGHNHSHIDQPLFIKIDEQGNILIEKKLFAEDAGAGAAFDVVQAGPNLLMITGFAEQSSLNATSIMALFTDTAGNIIRPVRHYSTTSLNNGFDIEISEDDNYLIAGLIEMAPNDHQAGLIYDTLSLLTGIEENHLAKNSLFSFYPNPVSSGDVITFSSDEIQLEKINIMNSLGKSVFSQKIQETSFSREIKIPKLSPGLYFIEGRSSTDQYQLEKLIVY